MEFQIEIGALGSNILLVDTLILYGDRSKGLVATDLEGNLAWEYNSKQSNSFLKIISDEKRVYLIDEQVKGLDLSNGELVWPDNSGSYAIRQENFILKNGFLVTSMYYDSDGVVVFLDKETGGVKCNGYEMPNSMGFSRYNFLNAGNRDYIFAVDGETQDVATAIFVYFLPSSCLLPVGNWKIC